MTYKQFMKAISRNKRKDATIDDEFVKQFKTVFADSKKDDQERMSAEALIDAVVDMIERQDNIAETDSPEGSPSK